MNFPRSSKDIGISKTLNITVRNDRWRAEKPAEENYNLSTNRPYQRNGQTAVGNIEPDGGAQYKGSSENVNKPNVLGRLFYYGIIVYDIFIILQ